MKPKYSDEFKRTNKYFNAGLFTRFYVPHLFTPYTVCEVNHKRHAIKIPLLNKGMEFIE